MLYDRWRQVCRESRNEIALRDLASGGQWTFGELDERAGKDARGDNSWLVHPSGPDAQFIFAVLRAWRRRRVICPLEPGQEPPGEIPEPPRRTVHLKTTSATTGAARLVAFTAGQLMADAQNIVQTMGLRPDWPNLGAVSLAHSYGFSNLVTPLLLHGIPLVLAGSALPEIVRNGLASLPAVTLAGVPALWRSWHEAGVLSSKIRLAISAGAPLPLPLEQAVFERAGLKIHNFYGATECGGIAYDRGERPRSDGSCAGSAMENVRLERGVDGCLEVHSAAVGETYWPEPGASLARGCYRTTDLAEIQAGAVLLRGRLTDQINVAGRKVSPETIEAHLRRHPAVGECVVFGVPAGDSTRTEVIVACLSGRADLNRELLKQFLLQHLPAWHVPRHWWFVDKISANVRGKFSRAEWRRKFLEQQREMHEGQGIPASKNSGAPVAKKSRHQN